MATFSQVLFAHPLDLICASLFHLCIFVPPPSPFQSYSQAGVNLKVLTTLCDGDSEVKLRCLASAMGVTRRPRTSCLTGSTSLSLTTWRWVEPVTLETKTQLNFNKVKVYCYPLPLLLFPLSLVTLLPPFLAPLLPSFPPPYSLRS